MRFRGKSVRRKIVALLLVPLVSLTSLWVFATYLTGREANRLLAVGNVVQRLGHPVEDVLQALRHERRQSLRYLADRRGADALGALHGRTRATDEALARLRADAASRDVREDLTDGAGDRLDTVLRGLAALPSLRARVKDNTATRDEAMEGYNSLADPGYDFLAALHTPENAELDKQGRALVGLARAREAVSREDALMSAVLASGTMSGRDLRALSDRAAERRVLYGTSLPLLPAEDRGGYEDYWRSAPARELASYEDRVIAAGARAGPRAVNAERWSTTAGRVLGDLERLDKDAGDRYQERTAPVVTHTLLKAAVAGVLGFVALLVSVIVSFRIGRRHVRDLTRLRKAAHEVAGVRLPSVMRRLAAGEQVDVETEAPRLEFGPDETGQVGQALNTLQRAAVEAAVKQADMRRGVSEVFVNLARRSQVLLHRQLTLLDAMERRTEDTGELADLFRLDHLTTRMRRHAEGLVILSGAAPSRQWRKPVQLMDVVRAAVAEVEDYERIEVRRPPRLAVDGPEVSDLTHLIAELLENATVFSPPHTAVQVLGERVANGYTLEIHDRGLGMAPDQLLEANLRLAETPEFELSDTDRLGLFVVSRLARRQHIRVCLQPSPYGGTTAVVLIPGEILTETAGGGRADDAAAAVPLSGGPVELEEPLGPEESGPAEGEGVLFGSRAGDRAGERAGDRARDRRGERHRAPGADRGRGTDRRRERARRGPGAAPSRPATGPRGIAALPPVSGGEPHQQTRDQAPGGPSSAAAEGTPVRPKAGEGLAPLPRRPRPPVLVADHGRTVEGRGREDDADAVDGNAVGGNAADSSGGKPPARRPSDADTGADADTVAGADTGVGAGDTTPPPRNPPRATTSTGLPRRVRQASLAPQLRAEGGPEQPPGDRRPEPSADDRDAEAVRARMASLQRGWQRGRRDHGDDDHGDGDNCDDKGDDHGDDSPETDAPPGTTTGGDGP
ncbi:nitrate- and nitrite sensing domain-containing protein [Streptomyces sp. NPDC001339]|uniref:sensor histidine kinase n=1 Tax=Streptomyces sp. NPDC001339 TaxID=3364563 RepID=UPI0036AA0D73